MTVLLFRCLCSNAVEMATVEKAEYGWRLTNVAGKTETVSHLLGDYARPWAAFAYRRPQRQAI